jgi:hypothetical protein
MLHSKTSNGKVPYPMGVDIEEFGKYGTGLRIFFDFIKKLAILFFIMSLVTIPALRSNSSGDGMVSYGERANQISYFSLANQPNLEVDVA